ncbi:hypothetical protein F7725_001991 [Dissostichus mawsoni]|uniref:Uncharacterized protein n=1 Tax=Dissostichus mawsoni TaxID=36200 RepID=A0A7J5Y153_DISMA|nr:hypothetical protein F7725_001991 [Dissostichus mawsoni]
MDLLSLKMPSPHTDQRAAGVTVHFVNAERSLDGSSDVRAPEVFKEYTAPPHCFTHVKLPTGCVAMLRPYFLVLIQACCGWHVADGLLLLDTVSIRDINVGIPVKLMSIRREGMRELDERVNESR